MKIIIACITIFISGYYPLYAQSNADYFPYEKNNYWEYYWLESSYPDTIVSLSVFDSVDSQGRKIAIFDSYFINPIAPPAILPDSGTYIIDSSLYVFSNWAASGLGCAQEYILVYHLNDKQGDQWVMCDYGGGGFRYEMARIKEIYEDVILNVPTTVMVLHYYLAEDSTDTTGLDRGYDALAKGFGLQFRQREGWPGILLKGAVIDGILYGDTTNIIVGIDETNQFNQLKSFELYQNFPNPFNPSTQITYSIISDGFVSFKIYDLLGNEVANLVDEKQAAGSHSIEFNAGSLPSGIYFYTLSSGSFISTKKLILLK